MPMDEDADFSFMGFLKQNSIPFEMFYKECSQNIFYREDHQYRNNAVDAIDKAMECNNADELTFSSMLLFADSKILTTARWREVSREWDRALLNNSYTFFEKRYSKKPKLLLDPDQILGNTEDVFSPDLI